MTCTTPICDFVTAYLKKDGVRLHMPGHKGRPFLGVEPRDITEIGGADELYHARGIIRESEENAARLFGAAKTLYSTEGSSLCIRAMVFLALMTAKERGRPPLILAGRNAHRAFLSAAALLDADVRWLYPPEGESGLIACPVTPSGLEEALAALPAPPAAVYLTSPDYLGHLLDIAGLAAVCRRHDTLLLTDNAHGAYLKFLPRDLHPITLGADLCCDSAHKTLPVLTGGAYLHIGTNAPRALEGQAERALTLFASSSPSYLILQSLDRCNAALTEAYREALAGWAARAARLKERLAARGLNWIGDEPLKITIAPKDWGYTGDQLHDELRKRNLECEFSDPDFLTALLTPALRPEEIEQLEAALLGVPRRPAIASRPPCPPRPERVMSIRRAMLSPSREMPVEEAEGRVLADARMGCPPCIPILAAGERIDRAAIACYQYYGVETCFVIE